jgi:16S rRNA (cytidine1402-2'-O)-methyltransferase
MPLYIVATPIGNLSDITLRALEMLKASDFILCEDTRVAGKLLSHYEIKVPMLAFHQHSTQAIIDKMVNLLREGKKLSLISDAGTPAISDPGGRLVQMVVEAGLEDEVIPIPGVSALTTALSAAGIPAERFLFLGFPPHKKGRQTLLRQAAAFEYPVVFFESKHRILKLLSELEALIPEKEMIIGRELTKMFEHFYRGCAGELHKQIAGDPGSQKGEFVVIINNK